MTRSHSVHSMRASITTALENGAQLEDVQKAADQRDPGTTKFYDWGSAPIIRPGPGRKGDEKWHDLKRRKLLLSVPLKPRSKRPLSYLA
jgi:hypothetical protein